MNKFDTLTKSEKIVLKVYMESFATSKEISKLTGISKNCVDTHFFNLLKKLGYTSRRDLYSKIHDRVYVPKVRSI
jgi:hypothetical protein